MLPETTKQRIERDAEKTYPVLHLNKNAGPNSRRNQRAYIAGATAEAEKAQRLADALEKIIEWVNDTGIKNVAIDDKKGMALYHSKHLSLNALQKWRGEKQRV